VEKIFIIDPLFINFLNFKNITSKKIIHINEAVYRNINFIEKKSNKKKINKKKKI